MGKLELNKAGVGALLRSAEIVAATQEMAQAVRQRCGAGYETDTHNAGQRMICSVYTATDEAAQDNLDNNTLLRAIGGERK